MANIEKYSFAHGTNVTYLENMLELYQNSPEQLDESWQQFFAGYLFALQKQSNDVTDLAPNESSDNAKLESYILAYRHLGHQSAHLNPLEDKPALTAELQPE